MTLKLTNNLDKKVQTLEVADMKDSRLNYHFKLYIPDNLPDGEYSYELSENGNIYAEGLLQIGDYKPDNKTYTTTENGYKQYRG